jgi:hypothetical protein
MLCQDVFRKNSSLNDLRMENGVSAGACRPGKQCDVPYGSDQFLCTDVNTQVSKPQLDKKCGGANSTKRVKVDRAWIAEELGKPTALP